MTPTSDKDGSFLKCDYFVKFVLHYISNVLNTVVQYPLLKLEWFSDTLSSSLRQYFE